MRERELLQEVDEALSTEAAAAVRKLIVVACRVRNGLGEVFDEKVPTLNDEGTKLLRFSFGVLTRVEASVLREVPRNATEDELRIIADRIYEDLDAEEFREDTEFWERGTTTISDTLTDKDILDF